MTDPVISPDGKSMWSGTEWIPIPPSHDISLNDFVVQGDINISSQVHHRNEIMNVEKDSKVCPRCGEENYNFSRICFGLLYKRSRLYAMSKKFQKDDNCEARGCDFCLASWLDYGPPKGKYFCSECLRANQAYQLKATGWFIVILFAVLGIPLLILTIIG